jgi:chromosome segregation ATPase
MQVEAIQAEADRTCERLQTTASELTAAQTQLDQLREQAAALRQEIADLTAARAELAEVLAAERERTEQQRQRAETAEQQMIRATSHIEHLSGELTEARTQVECWQAQAAEHRAELAGLRSELTAAHAAMETEKHHSTQRLADQQEHYEQLLTEFRVGRAGSPQQPARTSRRTGTKES